MPTMSPGFTIAGSNGAMASSTITGSPTTSLGVACAITKSQRGVMTLYPRVDIEGFSSMTFGNCAPFAGGCFFGSGCLMMVTNSPHGSVLLIIWPGSRTGQCFPGYFAQLCQLLVIVTPTPNRHW